MIFDTVQLGKLALGNTIAPEFTKFGEVDLFFKELYNLFQNILDNNNINHGKCKNNCPLLYNEQN